MNRMKHAISNRNVRICSFEGYTHFSFDHSFLKYCTFVIIHVNIHSKNFINICVIKTV